MFKTDTTGNKKSSSNQNVWCDHATMQQDVFSLSTPVDNSEAIWKKITKCNKLSIFEFNRLTFHVFSSTK